MSTGRATSGTLARRACPTRLKRKQFPHDRAFPVLSEPGSISRCQGFSDPWRCSDRGRAPCGFIPAQIKTPFIVPERPSRFLLIRGVSTSKGKDARRRRCGRCSEPIYFMERTRITVEEIASRLQLGRLAVYALLEAGEIPAIRLGRRWIITRFSYETWEHNCGVSGVRFDHGHTQAQV
jgi:excisionase family DNA binding protein